MKVLVVEDEERIAAFVGKGLRASGFEVDIQRTGRGALDAGGANPGSAVAVGAAAATSSPGGAEATIGERPPGT